MQQISLSGVNSVQLDHMPLMVNMVFNRRTNAINAHSERSVRMLIQMMTHLQFSMLMVMDSTTAYQDSIATREPPQMEMLRLAH
jgi:hypothetical protein